LGRSIFIVFEEHAWEFNSSPNGVNRMEKVQLNIVFHPNRAKVHFKEDVVELVLRETSFHVLSSLILFDASQKMTKEEENS